MKVFVALAIHPYRRQTFPFLKPYFSKSGTFREASLCDATFVATMDAATLVILPMSWNFYLKNNQSKSIEKVIKKAHSLGKKVISFTTGDYGVVIPDYNNLFVLRASGNESKLPNNHWGLPAFIEDPLLKTYGTSTLTIQPYSQKPTIGFCGMANTSVLYAFEELGRIVRRNLKYYLGFSKNLPQALIPTTFRRAQILQRFRKSDTVNDCFIFRKKYQAGAKTDSKKKETTLAFYNNIKYAQYVLCFRGAGNFSVRLYETLAMGRIPIFVNTDCILPLSDKVDWNKHMIWVEYKDRHKIVEKVLEFHHQFDENTFKKLQEQNRLLWEEKLTLEGFFKNLLIDKI